METIAAVFVTSSAMDEGPFCDAMCAAHRNGHDVEVRDATDAELADGLVCGDCGALLSEAADD